MNRALIAALSAGILLMGCAGVGTEGNASAASQTQSDSAAPAAQLLSATDTAPVAPDGEAPPMPDLKIVYGEIADITGNSVTIKEIEMPRPNIRDGEGMPEGIPEGFTPGEGMPEGMPEGFTPGDGMPEGFTPGDGMPEGMPEGFTPGEGGGRPGRQQGSPGGAPGAPRDVKYTGEEVKVIIPVGLAITTASENAEGVMETTEIQLADIGTGSIITIVYKEDGTTIDTVSISAAGTAGMMGRAGGAGRAVPPAASHAPSGEMSF